jgi:cysteine-rich repeat protein
MLFRLLRMGALAAPLVTVLVGCDTFSPPPEPRSGRTIVVPSGFATATAVATAIAATTPNQPVFEPPVKTGYCGDGRVDTGEACDDGNTWLNDGCFECEVERGFSCTEDGCFTFGTCGDGIVDAAEGCEPSLVNYTEGCYEQCHHAPGWTCFLGLNVCEPTCGDGILTGDEPCDDGNTQSGDGCNSFCQSEPLFVCAAAGTPCRRAVCGDGLEEAGEACDDGNVRGGDGCDAQCVREPTCVGAACETVCGDGWIVPGGTEACDDGNHFDGDGCSAQCEVEAGFDCTVKISNVQNYSTQTDAGLMASAADASTGAMDAMLEEDATVDSDPGAATDATLQTVGVPTSDAATDSSADAPVDATVDTTVDATPPQLEALGPSLCQPVCGDGLRVFGERCDDEEPGRCAYDCQVRAGCGDGIVDPNLGEVCDLGGRNSAQYGVACTLSCQLGPYCGDGIVQPPEDCEYTPGSNCGRCTRVRVP